jgi:hypothetical protein
VLGDGHKNTQAAEWQPARWGPTCGAIAPLTRFRGDSFQFLAATAATLRAGLAFAAW